MSVLESQHRIGSDDTESVEPNSKVSVLFFAEDIHGKGVFPGPVAPIISIEWIGKSLWWGLTSFNSTVPLFFDMTPLRTGMEYSFGFTMIGYGDPPSTQAHIPGPQFLCVEASIGHGHFSFTKKLYCIPPPPKDPSGLARRRFPRRRLIPTPDTTGLAAASCKR